MPCRFASSGTVATSRSASRAILALNVASNFLRDLVISVLHRLRQSRTLHTLTFGPISGVHFTQPTPLPSLDLFRFRKGSLKLLVEEPHRIKNLAEGYRCPCPVSLSKGEDAVVSQISHDRRVGNPVVDQAA